MWCQVVLLGSAPDPRIQNDFVNLANELHSSHADRARLCLTYDEPLSHLVCSCGTSNLQSVYFKLLHLQYGCGFTYLDFIIDLCWGRFHSSSFNLWAMWTDTTCGYEIWFNTCGSENWRCAPDYGLFSLNCFNILICEKSFIIAVINLHAYVYSDHSLLFSFLLGVSNAGEGKHLHVMQNTCIFGSFNWKSFSISNFFSPFFFLISSPSDCVANSYCGLQWTSPLTIWQR